MNTVDIRQRRPLAFHTRGGRITEPWAQPNARLLPREMFAAFPSVTSAYDELEKLLEASREHARDARRHRDLALKAQADSRAKVNDALASGRDANKVPDKSNDFTAKAEDHAALSERATERAKVKARELAIEMQRVAANLFPSLDDQLEAGAADIEEAQQALRAVVEKWGATWQARLLLSRLDLYGGHMPDYDPGSVAPSEFTEAEAAIGKLLAGPELLRKDEAQIRDEREAGVHA